MQPYTDIDPNPKNIATFDRQRRFGGLDRLYGPQSVDRLAQAQVVVAGIGGGGTWCVEALARSGLGALTLIDLDHIAESNINRQVHALGSTLGQAKIVAMAQRVRDINPHCQVRLIDDFVEPDNVEQIFSVGAGVLVDCTDQVKAKVAMVLAARARAWPIIVCGGAGGKTDPLSLRAGDLSLAVHDALLGRVRQVLRQTHGYPKGGAQGGKAHKRVPRMGVPCLWFEQPVVLPELWQQGPEEGTLQGLSCAGYGSAVTVTASMGLAAAHQAIQAILKGHAAHAQP
ncbi:tRNA threonylcarbamoyladenosine dehydratase [Alcaligenaceae bacterium CGII-47]|nr:tRNA threonylcarbamoyladenosine dehydratase [Alcaligenaceae bacterium CGII-47]